MVLTTLLTALPGIVSPQNTWGNDSVSRDKKRIIGATATVMEVSSGLVFPARVDTGAKSCSLHVERIVIKDKAEKRVRNVGKDIRFQVKDSDGQLHWMEGVIASAVRVKSPSLKSGEYDHRYKVKLTLRWQDFSKEVLVTLNDRTYMEYPLLLGRNFLRGDFLVDVEKTK
jgi:hypothetical protein